MKKRSIPDKLSLIRFQIVWLLQYSEISERSTTEIRVYVLGHEYPGGYRGGFSMKAHKYVNLRRYERKIQFPCTVVKIDAENIYLNFKIVLRLYFGPSRLSRFRLFHSCWSSATLTVCCSTSLYQWSPWAMAGVVSGGGNVYYCYANAPYVSTLFSCFPALWLLAIAAAPQKTLR